MAKLFGKKANLTDYTVSMLPQNRKQVFFDVFKLQWASLMRCGMTVLIFSAPMLLLSLIEDSYGLEIMKQMETATESERQALFHEMLAMSNTRAILNIFSFLLFSLCMAGLVRVIRQYAWEENVSVSSDFFRGLRQNSRVMVPLGLLAGVVNVLAVYSSSYSALASDALISVLLMIPAGAAIFIGIPIAAYSVVCISLYNNGLLGNLKMGLFVFAKTPLKTYLALICCFLPFAPQLIPNIYCHIFGGMVGCIISPFVMLAWYLFASNQLDEYINKEHFPSLVGKGTFNANNEN